jgi:hypothetical protein
LKFLRTTPGRMVLSLGLLAVVYTIGFAKGDAHGDAQCAAAAAQARAEAVAIEQRTANERAARDGARIAALERARRDDGETIAALQEELNRRPLQSTQPGAKRDPNALLDDQCRLTPRSAR